MIFLEIILLFGCIIYAAKLGGIGVGMAGGLGMAIAVFVLGLKPGAIPIDVILIILSVIVGTILLSVMLPLLGIMSGL
jgi:anaerobic C4-dicarboxylate transporter DcuA